MSTNPPDAPPRKGFRYGWNKYFGIWVVIALVLGAALGLVAQGTGAAWLTNTLDTIGSIFTSLLKFVVIPLVFTAIVVGINSLRHLGGTRTAARLGGKTLLWFAITSLVAVLIGIVIALITGLGTGVHVEPSAGAEKQLADADYGSWSSLITGLVPDNFFSAFSEGNILQVVFLALLVGAATYALGDKAEPFVRLNRSVFEIVQKIIGWVIKLAPVGVLGLIGNAFASYGDKFVQPLLVLIITVYVGCLLVMFVVYPTLLRFVAKVPPTRFFRRAWTVLQFAFVSRSSSATLPLSRQAAVDLGVEEGYASFAVPLGTTTKMDGCAAIYPALASIFIANLFGVQLSVWQYLVIVAVAVFGALATAGTTGWFTMLTLTLAAINLPPAVVATGVAIVYGIDPIMDMMRTATNVAGQMVVPIVVSSREKLLDRDRFTGHEPDQRQGTDEPRQEALNPA